MNAIRILVIALAVFLVGGGATLLVERRRQSPASLPLVIDGPAEPVTRRETWCPPPAYREADPGPLRGVIVSTITGATAMETTELAAEINRLVSLVDPAVEVHCASLSWPGGDDAVLVVLWERAAR